MKPSKTQLEKLRDSLLTRLLAARDKRGVWVGELSSSALATAVATFALSVYDFDTNRDLIHGGLNWLKDNVNDDGGWGDSPRSDSNLTTTLLCWGALGIGREEEYGEVIAKCEAWLTEEMGSLTPEIIVESVLKFYGSDRTFSAPILTMLTLSGRLGPRDEAWQLVPQLPFEMAALPHHLFHALNLRVVSYAVPALIAVGLVKHRNTPSRNPAKRTLRRLVKGRVLRRLDRCQPENGGFLEAAPLTAFVTMCLVGAGEQDLAVTKRGVSFLRESVRADGSWPIDTNLSTWLTTLSVNSLGGSLGDVLNEDERRWLQQWLIEQQFRQVHPFTHSKAGGWAWTDAPGGVPDADDTSGAILALSRLDIDGTRSQTAAIQGIRWLLGLQNKDGGMPTFCRGWGKLPFDSSCPDITAHALAAFSAWRHVLSLGLQKKVDMAIGRGVKYLTESQQRNGAWQPLWFGNQKHRLQRNPVYGTGVVVSYLNQFKKASTETKVLIKGGCNFLLSAQNEDGGWGGGPGIPSSIEETALALNALSGCANDYRQAIRDGVNYLKKQLQEQEEGDLPAAPIGLYFASLWYYEKLYPVIFALRALNRILAKREKGMAETTRDVSIGGNDAGVH